MLRNHIMVWECFLAFGWTTACAFFVMQNQIGWALAAFFAAFFCTCCACGEISMERKDIQKYGRPPINIDQRAPARPEPYEVVVSLPLENHSERRMTKEG